MKFYRLGLLLVGAILLSGGFCSCSSSDKNNDEETYNRWAPIANEIVKNSSSEAEKVQAIYNYICSNITYDTSYSIYTAEECWEKKAGVCEAYCDLFYCLANPLGLKIQKVGGYSRSGNNIGSHVWIAASYNGGWHLMDPCWGAGYVSGINFVKRNDPSIWYDVDPYGLIFSHYPDNIEWSMLPIKISKTQFEVLPEINDGLLSTGLDFKGLLTGWLDGSIKQIPQFGRYQDIKVLLKEIPLNGVLNVGETYEFVIQPFNGQKWFFMTDGSSIPSDAWIQNEDGSQTIEITPNGSYTQLTLNVMVGASSYAQYVTYRVGTKL